MTSVVAQTGTWTLYPAQSQTYGISIDQPINSDGSSVFSVKSTIPVQYDATIGYGPVVFSSYYSPFTYSNLDFAFSSPITLSQLTNLSAVYQFTTGTCHGGALRWSLIFNDGSTAFAYYGKDSTFWADCSSNPADITIDQSGLNLVNAVFDNGGGDVRYETSDHPGTYVNWAYVQTFASTKTITDAVLVLDSGWGGDQVLTLGHVTVNNNTFVPLSGTSTICPTQPATIQVSIIGPSGQLTIDESVDTNSPDSGNLFRLVDCKYKYNIAGKSLGKGQFQVDALINGVPATQPGVGTIISLK